MKRFGKKLAGCLYVKQRVNAPAPIFLKHAQYLEAGRVDAMPVPA